MFIMTDDGSSIYLNFCFWPVYIFGRTDVGEDGVLGPGGTTESSYTSVHVGVPAVLEQFVGSCCHPPKEES